MQPLPPELELPLPDPASLGKQSMSTVLQVLFAGQAWPLAQEPLAFELQLQPGEASARARPTVAIHWCHFIVGLPFVTETVFQMMACRATVERGILDDPGYLWAPHSGQNLAAAATIAPHLAQGASTARLWPQPGQNFPVPAGAPQWGQAAVRWVVASKPAVWSTLAAFSCTCETAT